MLGIIYLLLAILVGKEIAGFLMKKTSAFPEKQNRLWVVMPAAFGCGVLFLTWALYVISWLLSVELGMQTPLLGGNIAVMLLAAAGLAALYAGRKRRGMPLTELRGLIEDRNLFVKEAVFY